MAVNLPMRSPSPLRTGSLSFWPTSPPRHARPGTPWSPATATSASSSACVRASLTVDAVDDVQGRYTEIYREYVASLREPGAAPVRATVQ